MQTPTDIQFKKEKKRVCVCTLRERKKNALNTLSAISSNTWCVHGTMRHISIYLLFTITKLYTLFPRFFAPLDFCSLNRVWERDRALIERGFFFVFFIKMIWWVASHRRILIKRLIEVADFLGCFKRQVNYTYRRLIYTLSARNCLGIVRLWLLLPLLVVRENVVDCIK